MPLKRVYLSLGSNLGAREQNLDRALAALAAAGVSLKKRSSLYETAPQGLLDQPWFLNIAVECETKLFPMQLMAAALRIEREMGRARTVPNGPRLIDIDVLLFGKAVIESEQLTVPHPRMLERRFVLEPLLEIAPTLTHPVTRRPLKGALSAVMSQALSKFKG